MITATKYHDFSTGHRVFGHENKCGHPHGHNYRIHFTVAAARGLDRIGRVLDFSVIGELLCEWLEENWDHKFLVFCQDPLAGVLASIDPEGTVITDFNPTAENMAAYLVEVIGPEQLCGTDCELVEVIIEETRKCLATYKKEL